MKRFIIAALAVLALAGTAQAAEDVPAFSLTRISVAAGVDYTQFQTTADTPFPEWTDKKAWQPGIFAAYVLTPKVALTASASMNTESHWVEYRVGARVILWKGAD